MSHAIETLFLNLVRILNHNGTTEPYHDGMFSSRSHTVIRMVFVQNVIICNCDNFDATI